MRAFDGRYVEIELMAIIMLGSTSMTAANHRRPLRLCPGIWRAGRLRVGTTGLGRQFLVSQPGA